MFLSRRWVPWGNETKKKKKSNVYDVQDSAGAIGNPISIAEARQGKVSTMTKLGTLTASVAKGYVDDL